MPSISRLIFRLALLTIGVVPIAHTCCAQDGLELSEIDLLSNDGNIYFENSCWSDYRSEDRDSYRNESAYQATEVANLPVQMPEPRYKLSEFNIYPTFSFLNDQVGNYTEFEFASHTQLGRFELENRTVMNVADLPGTIKLGAANPDVGGPTTASVRGNGFGDTLSGFFFSIKDPERKFNLGIGPVVTAPTASNELLGSDQWTLGPGAHFTTEIGRLTTGFFVWQSWGLTNNPAKKQVNQLFGKPYFIYELTEKWNLIYIPLGLSHSWKSPDGDDWTIPLGGGVRRLFKMRGKTMGLQFQAFDYVSRKPTDPEWELRCTIEFLFD